VNAAFVPFSDNRTGQLYVTVVALADIKEQEKVCIDYGEAYWSAIRAQSKDRKKARLEVQQEIRQELELQLHGLAADVRQLTRGMQRLLQAAGAAVVAMHDLQQGPLEGLRQGIAFAAKCLEGGRREGLESELEGACPAAAARRGAWNVDQPQTAAAVAAGGIGVSTRLRQLAAGAAACEALSGDEEEQYRQLTRLQDGTQLRQLPEVKELKEQLAAQCGRKIRMVEGLEELLEEAKHTLPLLAVQGGQAQVEVGWSKLGLACCKGLALLHSMETKATAAADAAVESTGAEVQAAPAAGAEAEAAVQAAAAEAQATRAEAAVQAEVQAARAGAKAAVQVTRAERGLVRGEAHAARTGAQAAQQASFSWMPVEGPGPRRPTEDQRQRPVKRQQEQVLGLTSIAVPHIQPAKRQKVQVVEVKGSCRGVGVCGGHCLG